MIDQLDKFLKSVRDVFFLERTPITTDALGQVAQLTIITALASLFDIIVFTIASLGRLDMTSVLLWAIPAAVLPLSSLRPPGKSAAKKNVKRISRRGLRKSIAYAVLFAAPWALLPLLFLGGDPFTDILIVALTAGMASAGAFMLCPIPAAAIVYFTVIEVAVIIGCAIAGLADFGALAALTLPYIAVLTIVTLRSFRLSQERAQGLRKANEALNRLERANVELDQLRDAAEKDAVIDELTGLYNRRGLSKEIAKRQGAECAGAAVLHLDLDRFKQINDTLGHAAGDQILRHAADLLRANTRDRDFVARIGGDEFVIIADFCGKQKAIEELAARLIKAMRDPIQIEGEVCNFGVSIGVDFARSSPDHWQMLVNADLALYRAKASGRSRFHLFSPMLAEQVRREKSLGDDLLAAVAERQLEVVYQPQFLSEGRELAALEALVRWRHPKRGLLSPAEFLPLAQRLGVISDIDQIVLETALQQVAEWEQQGFRVPALSVNVSAARFCDPDLSEKLAQMPIPQGRLSFEINETDFLGAIDDTMSKRIERLAEQGVALELDGFTASQNALTELVKYRPSRVKIAQNLVKDSATIPQMETLTRALADIARSLDIGVTAEGVETETAAVMASRSGCDRLQGFHLCIPMDANTILHRFGASVSGKAKQVVLSA